MDLKKTSSASRWDLSRFDDPLKLAYEQEDSPRSWPQEKENVLGALACISAKLPPRYTPDREKPVLGVGGSGIVLRINDSLFPAVDNALKFPRPVPGKIELVAEMLSKEIGFLANLRHPGIVKILYYTTLQDVPGYGNLPFYLMEAVEGSNSKKFARDSTTTQAQLLRLILETAEVIRYLHTEASPTFAHLDIKPDNIVVEKNGRAVMIDLGTCKRLGGDKNKTLVACSEYFAHPHLLNNLDPDPTDKNRSRGELPRNEIDANWDLWAFGLTILYWMGLGKDGKELQDPMLPRLDPYVRKYLILVVARLLIDVPPKWLYDRVGLNSDFLEEFRIDSSLELGEILNRLDRRYSPLDNVRELQSRSTGTIQAAPGIHLANTARLQRTLNHRFFRRLSGITQLGLASQVYPSAKHSRREHSLGTYANATRVIRALYNDFISPFFKQIIQERDIRDLLLSALLHDIGQFPMAHDLEDVDRVFDHEALTEAMIKGVWHTKKRGGKTIRFDSLDEVFRDWDSTPERVLSILNARATDTSASARQKLLRSIISGPIDADKLDYLARDARATDVPYPLGIDVQMILRMLTTIVVEVGNQQSVPAIGIHSKGKVAAEFLTLARYAMFSQVYWHHAVRVQKAMLFRAVEALLGKDNSDAKIEAFKSRFIELVYNLPEVLYENPETAQNLFSNADVDQPIITKFGKGTDLAATDAAVLSWFLEGLTRANLPEASLIDGILTRRWFKRLWIVSRDMEPDRWDNIVHSWKYYHDRKKRNDISHEFELAILDKLTKDKTPPTITNFPAGETVEKIRQLTSARRPWLLIDIPAARPGSDIPLSYVLESHGRRMRKDDRVVGHCEKSGIWVDYAENLSRAAGKIRVFAHPDFVDFLDASLSWNDGISTLQSELKT